MAAPEILDTESDYGYDFSQEEEALLIQLAADKQQVLVEAHLEPPLIDSEELVDVGALPEQIFGKDDGSHILAAVDGLNSQRFQFDVSSLEMQTTGSNSTCIPPDEDIGYPDRELVIAI